MWTGWVVGVVKKHIRIFWASWLLVGSILVSAVSFCAYGPGLKRLTKGGIDVKTTGTTLLATTENGTESFHPLFCVFKCTAVSGFIAASTLSVGTNSTAYNNTVPGTLMTGLSTAGSINSVLVGATGTIPANTQIYVNVTIPTTATSQTLEVTLIGYYQ